MSYSSYSNPSNLINLSHTSIEGLERCPRCFWLAYNKNIRQPEGIVSRLANRFDGVLKNYFNIFRATGELPPMVEGKLKGKLQKPFREKYWAEIPGGKYQFYGKLDECLEEDGKFSPVDFKTASSDPRPKELLPAYKNQIDDYVYLLSKNKLETTGHGYLIFVYPDLSDTLHDGFPMVVHVVKVKGNPENTEKRIKNAIKVIEGKIPESSPSCEFCQYRELRLEN